MKKADIAYIIVDGSVLADFSRRLILEGNGACATGAFLRRAKQQQLSAIELAKGEELFYKEQYNRLRLSGKLGSVLDTDPFEKYFKYSGLPKIVLKQICIESGILPDRQIDFDRFAQCCRMIAHCQSSVVRCDLAVIRTMELGGHGLTRMLRQSLVTAPFMRPNCVTAFGRLWPSRLPVVPLLQSHSGRRRALCIALGASRYLGLVPLAKLHCSDFKVSLLLWKCCFTAVPNVRTKRCASLSLKRYKAYVFVLCCFNV